MLCCFLYSFTSSFCSGSPRWRFASRQPGSPCLTQCSSLCWFPLKTKWWTQSWNVVACCLPPWRGLLWGCSLLCVLLWLRVSAQICPLCTVTQVGQRITEGRREFRLVCTYNQGHRKCSLIIVFYTGSLLKHGTNTVCQCVNNSFTQHVEYRHIFSRCLSMI